MPGIDVSDRARCEELACVPGSVFELAHRFLPGPAADRVLAMEAFFVSIREIPLRIADPSVALAKLAWWTNEMDGIHQAGTQHPVLRALLDTGMLEELLAGDCEDYLSAQFEAVHRGPPESPEEFESYLLQVGGREALIWAGLERDHRSADSCQRIGLASRLLDCCAVLTGPVIEKGWLPREWRTRYGLDGDLHEQGHLPELLEHLAGLALDHHAAAGADWESFIRRPGRGDGARFLAIRTGVERRRLERFRARPTRMVGTGGVGGSFTDVLIAWQRARQAGRAS